MNYDFFISYRRSGAQKEAIVLYYNLKAMGYRVFLDFTSLHSGKFTEEIREAISNTTYFILLIHPTAFNRCTEKNDCYRQEIEHALENNKHIIPILVNQDNFPTNIPEHLRKITEYNYVPSFPLQLADEIASKLVNHYLKGKPELKVEAQKKADPRETCPNCGCQEIKVLDITENLLSGQKQSMLFFRIMQIFFLLLFVLQLTILIMETENFGGSIMYDWMNRFLPHMLAFLTDDSVSSIGRFISLLAIQCLSTGGALVLRRLTEKYRNMIIRKEEDVGIREIGCLCKSCRINYHAEVSVRELPKQKHGTQIAGILFGLAMSVFLAVLIPFMGELFTVGMEPSFYPAGLLLGVVISYSVVFCVGLYPF